jgi:hypothetical protein
LTYSATLSRSSMPTIRVSGYSGASLGRPRRATNVAGQWCARMRGADKRARPWQARPPDRAAVGQLQCVPTGCSLSLEAGPWRVSGLLGRRCRRASCSHCLVSAPSHRPHQRGRSLDQQAAKAAADVRKAHQLVAAATAARGGLCALLYALREVLAPLGWHTHRRHRGLRAATATAGAHTRLPGTA